MRFVDYIISYDIVEQKIPHDVPLHKVVRMFHQFGFDVVRETPHVIMRNKKGKTIAIPNHKHIKSSTLRQLINISGIDREKAIKEL